MPEIKQYENTANVSPKPFEDTAFSLERFGRINAESIEQGAKGLSSVAGTIATHEARIDVSDIGVASATQNAKTFQAYADWKSNHPYDPIDPNASYNDFLEEHVNKPNEALKGQARTQAGADAAERFAAQRSDQWTRVISADRVNEDQQRITDNTNAIVNSNSSLAALHPEQAPELIKQTQFYLEAMLPSNLHKDAIGQAASHIAASAIDSAYAQLASSSDTTIEHIRAVQDHLSSTLAGFASPEKFAQLQEKFATLVKDLPAKKEQAERQQVFEAEQASDARVHDFYNVQLAGQNPDYDALQRSALQDKTLTREGQEATVRFIQAVQQDRLAPIREARAETRFAREEEKADKARHGDALLNVMKSIDDDNITTETELNTLATDGIIPLTDLPVLRSALTNHKKDDGTIKDLRTQAYDWIAGKYFLPQLYHQNYATILKLEQNKPGDVAVQDWYDPNSPKFFARGLNFNPPPIAGTNPSTHPVSAVIAPVKSNINALQLDKIPRSEPGAKQGMDTLRRAVVAGKILPSQAKKEAIDRGWWSPPAKK